MEQMSVDQPVTSSSSPADNDPPNKRDRRRSAGADGGTDQHIQTSKHTPQLPLCHTQTHTDRAAALPTPRCAHYLALFLLCSISVSEAIKKKTARSGFPQTHKEVHTEDSGDEDGNFKGNQSLACFVKVERAE